MKYDAFISYSHDSDNLRARHIRQALHTFARPWNSIRALRVFLDNAALSADSSLWNRVQDALGDSNFLILLASPKAARSPWVAKELTWWLQGPRANNLIFVVTEGEMHWCHSNGDFDWDRTTCLPHVLKGKLEEEPRWVDMRWTPEDHRGDLNESSFRECIADIAAPLHGRSKDELTGEDISQRRKFKRFRQSMLAGISVMALLFATAAVYAFVQRNEARDQARIATARQLAATSLNLSEDDLEVASLLAIQGYQVKKTPETLSALYRLATKSPHLVRFVRGDARVTALALASSSRFMAFGTAKGSVSVRAADGSRTRHHVNLSGSIKSLTFSDDDRMLAAGTSEGETITYDLRSRVTHRYSAGGESVRALTFRPTTRNLAAVDADGILRAYEEKSSKPLKRIDTKLPGVLNISYSDEGNKLFASSTTGWRLFDSNLRKTKSYNGPLYPHNGYVSAVSPSGKCFGYMKYGAATLEAVPQVIQGEDINEAGKYGCASHPALADKEASSLAIADDNRIAIGTSTGITLAGVEPETSETFVDELPGVKTPSVLAFAPGQSNRLASADGSTVALWDLVKPGPTMHEHGLIVPDGATVETQPPIALAPNGYMGWSSQATGAENESALSLHLLSPNGDNSSAPGSYSDYGSLAFSKDGRTLYATTTTEVDVWKRTSGKLRKSASIDLPDTPPELGDITRVASGPNGDAVILMADGSVSLLDPEAKRLSSVVKGDSIASASDGKDKTIALSDDGSLAVVGQDDGHIMVYEIPSGRMLRKISHGGETLDSLAVSSEDRSLYAVTNGRVLRKWDVATGETRWRSDGAGRYGIAVNEKADWAATLSGDGSVWLWNTRTGDRLGSTILPTPKESFSGTSGTGAQSSLAFSTNGNRLWSITEGGEVLSADTSVKQWIKTLCDRVGRRLSGAERTRYLTSTSSADTACGKYPAPAR